MPQNVINITFKSETSRHDFCAKHVVKYIIIMETLNRIIIFMVWCNKILYWKQSLKLQHSGYLFNNEMITQILVKTRNHIGEEVHQRYQERATS